MIVKKNNLSFSEQLQIKQKQHNISKQDFSRVFQKKLQVYPTFQLNQIKGQITNNQIFKKLVAELKQWNYCIESRRQDKTQLQIQIYKFLYKSLITITFEHRQIQLVNLKRLENWYYQSCDIKKNRREIVIKPVKSMQKQNRQFNNTYKNFQAFSRLKHYNRRTFQLQPKLIYRRQVKAKDNQIPQKKYSNYLNEKKILNKQMKNLEQSRQLQQIKMRVKLMGKAKSRYEENIINKTEFSNFFSTYHIPKKESYKEKNNSYANQQNLDENKNDQFIKKLQRYLQQQQLNAIRIRTAAVSPKLSFKKQNIQQQNRMFASKTTLNFKNIYKKVFDSNPQNISNKMNTNGVSLMINPFMDNKKDKIKKK